MTADAAVPSWEHALALQEQRPIPMKILVSESSNPKNGPLLLLASLVALAVCTSGCASADEAAAADDDYTAAITWKPVAFAVPSAHASEAAREIFSSESEFRSYFGVSCGLFCNNEYKGALPASFTSPAGKTRVLVFVNNPKVPRGRTLVIKSIGRSRNKWLDVTTCTRAGTSSTSATAVVDAEGMQPLIWISSENGTGLEAC